ncbi:MAG: AAA family ATPase [Deltaproteobacteria bacterium]|nr:AAA family ATPase [Deltaproteobacteria bacterium]
MTDLPSTHLDRMRRELSERFLEREAVVEGLLCALLARAHVLIVGPPGTGKSELAHELCRRVDGVQYFQWLLTRFTTPEELFGPVSLKALEGDRYTRVTEGKLPRAHVVFLDEVFKASSAILNTLLALMNERRYHGGDGPEEAPLISLVGAANELPEEDELVALFDRFLLRFDVDYLREDYLFLRMLALEPSESRATLPLAELTALQARVAAVRVPEGVRRDLLELRNLLNAKGVIASDRRYRQSLDLLRARAVLAGRDACISDDLQILEHVLWSEPNERSEVQEALRSLAFGLEEEAQRLLFHAREIAESAQGAPEGEEAASHTEALAKLHDLSRRLDGLVRDVEARGKRAERVAAYREEVKALVRRLLVEDEETEADEPSRTH